MSGLDDQAVSDIEAQIRASQEQVLKCVQDIESHNASINKVLTNLADVSKTLNKLSLFTQKIKTSEPILIKVKDPLEELKKVRDEFDKDILKEKDLELIKQASLLVKESFYENNPKNILRCGWIQSITFKNCENVKSVSLHFEDLQNEFKFNYSLDETSNECIMRFGSPDSSHIINNTIHTSMFPISLLPYQSVYFTCEKIDETKPCNATILYAYYDVAFLYKICLNRIVFTIQGKKLFITTGLCVPCENKELLKEDITVKIQDEYIGKIIDILSLYKDAKISATFKEIFLKIFNESLQFKNECDPFNGKKFKKAILKVRDIRWLLLEMEKYPQFFQFNEDDLELMKQHSASRDNIYLVKKFLKKDGDYEEYYPEEEGGGIKCQYHMTGGLLNGEYKEWYDNGQIRFQGYYKDGERENEYKSWLPTGQLLEHMIYDKDGTDEYKMWYENEQIWSQCYYKEGKREGEYKFWYENGHLEGQIYYKEGKLDGECKWWHRGEDGQSNGQLKRQVYYKEGKLEGVFKEWYGDRTLKEEVFYQDGKEEGEAKEWHSNGQLSIQCYYKEGKLEGEFKKWNEEGNLIEYKIYRGGEIVEDLLALEGPSLI